MRQAVKLEYSVRMRLIVSRMSQRGHLTRLRGYVVSAGQRANPRRGHSPPDGSGSPVKRAGTGEVVLYLWEKELHIWILLQIKQIENCRYMEETRVPRITSRSTQNMVRHRRDTLQDNNNNVRFEIGAMKLAGTMGFNPRPPSVLST